MVRHPYQTAQGIGSSILHPVRTYNLIKNDVIEKSGSLRGQGELAGDFLIGIATGDTLKAASKTATVANLSTKMQNAVRVPSRAPRGTSFIDDMTPAEAARYQEYWQRYSPNQVSPGMRRMDFERVSGRTGRTETSRVVYDEHGRQIYRVDRTDHMRPEAHSNPHLHEYQYGPGYDPHRELLHNLDGR